MTSATYGSYEQDKRTCLEGTQVYALERIQEWSLGSEGKPILWFQGMAGTGKSTIARTAAAAFRNGKLLPMMTFFLMRFAWVVHSSLIKKSRIVEILGM